MAVDLTRLISQLNNSNLQESNNPLYQVIYQILIFSKQIQDLISKQVTNNTSSLSNGTFLTVNSEPTLPLSRKLLAGTSISFNDTVPGQRTINGTGGITAAQVATRVSLGL